jgi:peptidoglycan/LPS O-acetylase OafA/YrhL
MLSFLVYICIIRSTDMQKIIDNLGITISAVCAIHCVFLPVLFLLAPYSFLASHEFHEVLIYFIIPSALVAFVMGCRKHGDKLVAIMGSAGILLLIIALSMHNILHTGQHSEEFLGIVITISGSVLLIFSHLRNRKLCMQEKYSCHHNY